MTDTPFAPALVLYEKIGHIALVTLNRPEKRNAVNAALADELEAIARAADADPEVRVAILTSSSHGVFCAGADLGAVAAGQARGIETSGGGFAGFVYLPRRKPWIAVIEGMALAGGCEIALACDMIVASTSAKFGLPEVKRGLVAGAGGIHRIGTVLPRNVANEMLVTGDALDAVRAYHFGMVNRLTEPGEALAAAKALADCIAQNAPLAVQCSLTAARSSTAQPDGAGRAIVAERFAALRLTDDFKEGPRAFIEKRAPVWTGR